MRTRQPYSTRWPAKVMPSLLRRMAASVTLVDDQSRDSVQGRADCQRPGACGGPAPRRRQHRSQFQTEGDQNARDQPSTAFPASDAGAWTQKCKRAPNGPPAHRCPQRARPPPSRQPLLVLAKIADFFCFLGKARLPPFSLSLRNEAHPDDERFRARGCRPQGRKSLQ